MTGARMKKTAWKRDGTRLRTILVLPPSAKRGPLAVGLSIDLLALPRAMELMLGYMACALLAFRLGYMGDHTEGR